MYDPLADRFHAGPADYFEKAGGPDPARPTVGLLFYGGMHMGQSLAGARALARRLQPHCNIFPVYGGAGRNLEALRSVFLAEDAPGLDALVYIQWFQLATFSGEGQGETLALLRKLGVPVFDATPMFGREIHAWRDSPQGLSPIEVMTSVILPELDA